MAGCERGNKDTNRCMWIGLRNTDNNNDNNNDNNSLF